MLAWMGAQGAGDPGRVHFEGRLVRGAVEQARDNVAHLLGVRSRQIIFTSGATEAIATAVWSATASRPGGAILCPAVEHSAVRDSSARLAQVIPVGTDDLGRVDPEEFMHRLDEAASVALAHIQWANHEVGTIQSVGDIVRACRERGVPVHVDAASAAGHLPMGLDDLGADFVSVSAHKMGGPKGIGALILRRGVRIDPLLRGGEQERGRRAGLENVPAIAGFGAAAAAIAAPGCLQAEAARARLQTDAILAGALGHDGVLAYGDATARVPHIVCVGVAGVEAEAVLLGLDQAGVAVHSGSACSSESLAPSPVLEAMGVQADHSLRISVGWSTSNDDVEAFASAFPAVVERLRSLGRH